MKRMENILWGIVLIAIGMIWALNAAGLTNISIFFTGWWTLFIIVPCAIGLFTERERTGNIIGLVIGISLLFACNGILDFALLGKMIVPFVLVCVGLSIIFKDVMGKKIADKIKNFNKEGLEEYSAIFGGQKIVMADEEFKGCSLNAIFGGIDLDLRGANITGEYIINSSSIFGGIEVTAPANVNIKVKSTPIFGGVSNKTSNIRGENIPTIYINAFCLFGGVEIK